MRKSLIGLLLVCVLSSCDDDLSEGISSLQGHWRVAQAESMYRFTLANGNQDDNPVSEEGNLGQFVFQNDTVNFQFTRNDTLYQGTERWYLRRERVNQGFVKVNQFTLDIENNSSFTCEFDDGTRDSEDGATKISLISETEDDQSEVWFQLILLKE